MENIQEHFWTITIAIVSIVATAKISYYYGRKKAVDEIRLKKGFEIAEQIAVSIQAIHEDYVKVTKNYQLNFSETKNVDVAAQKMLDSDLYQADIKYIDELWDKREKLSNLVKSGRLYLDAKTLELIESYLSKCSFSWQDDGGLISNTYLNEFLRNLTDSDTAKIRNHTYKKILPRLKKLVG